MKRSGVIRIIAALAAAVPLWLAPSAARSAASHPAFECTLIVDMESGKVIVQKGVCDQRISPASTFKVPLAVMGYDSGILKDGNTPAWDYRPEFNAVKRDHRTVDPTIWERDSVLWYSQEITRRLGMKTFAAYVSDFGYGNADVAGLKGKDDGLTRSWVSSSLAISPVEQVDFLSRLLARELPVSDKATDAAIAIIPVFDAGGWKVTGKTGSARLRDKAGDPDRNRPFGWFVGWGEREGRRIVFARLVIGTKPADGAMGLATRASFLADLPALVPAE